MSVISDIPSSWARASLSEVCLLLNGDRGKNYPSKDKRSSEGLPFVNAGDISGISLSTDRIAFISEQRFNLLNGGKFGIGDILYCIRGSLGKVALNTTIERGAIASSLIIVRPKSEINGRYILHYLCSPLARHMINKFDNGTAQPNLSGADLGRFEVPLAPAAEQSRIVARLDELLSELEKGSEYLQTARRQLVVHREALLERAFRGDLTAGWRAKNKSAAGHADGLLSSIRKLREQAYTTELEEWSRAASLPRDIGQSAGRSAKPRPPKLVTELPDEVRTRLPDLPSSWVCAKLGWMTCGVEYGTAAKSSVSGCVPVIRMGNIQNGAIDWADLVFTSDQDEIQKYSLMPGDVLFNRTNSPELVGKTALYRGEMPAVFAGYLIRINHIRSIVDSEYLALFLNSRFARNYGNSVKTDGVNQSNINGEKLQSYPFPYCHLDEQREVVRLVQEKLSITDRMMEDIDGELARAEALRASILQKAFSGGLVPQNSRDEPAAKLLERIGPDKAVSAKRGRKHTSDKRNSMGAAA